MQRGQIPPLSTLGMFLLNPLTTSPQQFTEEKNHWLNSLILPFMEDDPEEGSEEEKLFTMADGCYIYFFK